MAMIYNIYHPEKGYLAYYRSPIYLGWTPDVKAVIAHEGTMSRQFKEVQDFLVKCMNEDIEAFKDAKIVYRMDRNEEPEIDHRFQPYQLVDRLIIEKEILDHCSVEFKLVNALTNLGIREFDEFINSFDVGDMLVRIPIAHNNLVSMMRTAVMNRSVDDRQESYGIAKTLIEDFARQFAPSQVDYEQHFNLFKVKAQNQMLFKLSVNETIVSFVIDHKMNICTKKE
jgi:hypothetical protein